MRVFQKLCTPFLSLFQLRGECPMWLFVGLGNPEQKYMNNRHNVGFMVVDALGCDPSFTPFRSKFDGLVSEGRLGEDKILLLKPQTYMNESGRSVQKCAKFYKIPPENIIVFHDDLDLLPGKVKVKQGGGTGGHNGLKSLDACLGDKNYWRVRLGIGHPGDKNRVSGYVLSDFSKAEQENLPSWIYYLVKNTPLLLSGDKNKFMTQMAEEKL